MRFPLKTAGFVFGGALSAAVFYYYGWIIRPEYVHFLQQPVFFADRAFLAERLRIPGGFLDFISAFLTDLYRFGWPGAFILSGLALTVCLLLFRILRPGRRWIAPVLPVIPLLMAQARFDYPVVKTLSLVLGLEAFILLRDLGPENRPARLGVTVAALAAVYCLSPGAALLFAALCILREILDSGPERTIRSVSAAAVMAAVIAAAAAFVPWAGRRWIFLVSERNAFLRHSPLWRTDVFGASAPPGIPWDGVAAILILVLAGVFMILPKSALENRTTPGRQWMSPLQAAAMVLLIAAGAFAAADRNESAFLAVRLASHRGESNRVIERINGPAARIPLCLPHFNRALFHAGRLESDFFLLPGNFGGAGLFPDRDSRFQAPLDCSDLYFELGHNNEAKRWAFEALTLYGESSEVLERLALTHLIAGEDSAAARFLDRLRLNPLSRRRADRLRPLLSGTGGGELQPAIAERRGRMPVRDFIVDGRNPENDLEKLAARSPDNRMAVAYLLMSDLLDRDLDAFARNLVRFRSAVSDPLPSLYEEGLIACLSTRRPPDAGAAAIPVRKATLERFADFERILQEHGIRSDEAAGDLGRSHAATYWFYMLYAKPAE
jgi:hypothetical protein